MHRLFLLVLITIPAAHCADDAGRKIDLLISAVENSKLTFIRNGEKYTAAQSAKFLNEKRRLAAALKSPTEFIEKCASKSGLSGESYTVIAADGKTEVPLSNWLEAVLAGIQIAESNVPAPVTAPQNTKELIVALGSDSFEEREKATRLLMEMGMPIIDELDKTLQTTKDAEVKVRCEAIRKAVLKPNRTALAALKLIEKSPLTFVRPGGKFLGSAMDGSHFAAHLQGKAWIQGFSLTESADAFIEKMATRSSLRDKTYQVRLEDGSEVELKKWLEDQLK